MFAHVLAKTIIDETGDGNSRVPCEVKVSQVPGRHEHANY